MSDTRDENEGGGLSLSAPFVRRPIATALFAIGILVLGGVAYFQLPVAALPRVDSPTIMVQAQLPGASPETMAASMAAPLERRFGRIAGLTEMTSTSTLGSSNIILQFDLERSIEGAGRDVQAAIAAASGDLPSDLPSRPTQRRIDPSDSPIMIVAIRSDTLGIPRLFDYADSVLAPRVASLEGVGQVIVGGSAQPAIRIEVDPSALGARGIGMDEVRAAVSGATRLRPAGRITGNGRRFEIQPSSQLFGPEAYRDVAIRSASGTLVRLGDVAEVSRGVVNDRAAAWADGRQAVLLVIRREPGANVIETVDRIRAILPQLRELVPPAVELEPVIDRSHTIRAAVDEVQQSLVMSVLLVVFVVFLFLRSVRATLVPSVAVPLSLAGTFAVMYLMDFSLNVLSLMALTVSTGFVVDDAIVVTENVVRYLEKGMSPMRAALEGARQIGFTIVSITAALLAVFLPILFMGGVVGRLFREMALTLGVAITISAFVSLTVTPAMCAQLLRGPHAHASEGRISRWLGRGFDALSRAYGVGLDRALRFRKTTLFTLLLAVGLTGVLAYQIPKGLFPTQDTGIMFGSTAAPDDVSFPALVERQLGVTEIIRADPAVEHVVAFIGSGPGGGSANTSSLFASLRPMSERQVAASVVAGRIGRRFANDPEVQVFFTPAQDLRVGGRMSRSAFQYTLQGDDVGELRAWSARLVSELRTEPTLRQVSSDQTDAGLALHIAIDRARASRLGITPRDIDVALSSAFGQRQIATTYHDETQVRVVLEVSADQRDTPDDLANVHVRSASGELVPLRAITTVTRERTPLAVNHQGQIPSVTVTFDMAPGGALADAVRIVEAARARIHLPSSIQAGFAGTAQTYQASAARQPILILAAILVVYLVLGMLYESLIHPLTILSTLPPAAVGALVVLWAVGLALDVVALIGIVLLVGIVAKNAIMMIDFAIEKQREEGLTADRAIHQAATQRFRPILMTTLAAIGGAIPLALGTDVGSELRVPLGVTIASGLAASQLLTLFTTPVVYVTLDRFAKTTRKAPDDTTDEPSPTPHTGPEVMP
ncbi:MAG: efflux RND transporter permease subunit [Deltaproteobacteria bacterium]|nr:efflux RND transporter permease subunit [Deltaproteobacteria bacterium]